MKQIDLGASFVTAVTDIDVDHATPQDIAVIRELVYARKVVALRNQPLSRAAYLRFARHFGEPEPFRLKHYHDPEYPQILVIDNRHGGGKSVGARKLGNMWHSDSSYLPEPLPLTLLHAQRVPQALGDTLFVDMEDAMRRLPPDLRERIAGRRATHDVRWTYKVKDSDLGESIQEIFDRLKTAFPAASHPTIVRHPRTGRESLYVNPGYTTHVEPYGDTESRALLADIFAQVISDEHIFAYRWAPNDLLIWDNRAVIHCATTLPREAERVMHRIGIDDGPFFAPLAAAGAAPIGSIAWAGEGAAA